MRLRTILLIVALFCFGCFLFLAAAALYIGWLYS